MAIRTFIQSPFRHLKKPALVEKISDSSPAQPSKDGPSSHSRSRYTGLWAARRTVPFNQYFFFHCFSIFIYWGLEKLIFH